MVKLWSIYEKSNVFRTAQKRRGELQSASMFVCGMILREVFCADTKPFPGQKEYGFEYLWHNVCRYHKEEYECSEIWEEVRRNKRSNPKMIYTWKDMGVWSMIEDYYFYRDTCCVQGGMDHGIVGGILLYEAALDEMSGFFSERNVAQMDGYLYMANTLLVHNLWKKEYHESRISFEDDMLLCMLVLAEVVEPTQYANECTAHENLLNEICVELDEKELIMYVNPDFFQVEQYINSVRQLATMVKIECETEENKIRIYSKNSNY